MKMWRTRGATWHGDPTFKNIKWKLDRQMRSVTVVTGIIAVTLITYNHSSITYNHSSSIQITILIDTQ